MSTFSFESKAKKNLLIAIAIGALLFFIGLFTQGGNHNGGHDTHGEAVHAESHDKGAHTEASADDHGVEHVAAMDVAEDLATNSLTDSATANTGSSVSDYQYKDVSADIDSTIQNLGDRSHYLHEEANLNAKIVANVYSIFLFFLYIGIAALFVLSAATLALGGWHIQIQKIFLAIAATIPVSILGMVIIYLTNMHTLFHWTHEELFVKGTPLFDELLYGKRDWLNITSFAIRAVIFFGITLSLLYFWWKNLNEQDTNPSMKLYDKSRAISGAAILLISMGVNPFGTWDWAMSIQPHWYSTLYAWYLMASGAVSMFSLTMLLIIYLKKRNNLALVNESHRHDVGKFMFAISVFWTYLFFSQFMLIWYANIPEETMYFDRREAGYFIMFWGSFIVCFILPFFILMRRGSKRNSVTTQVMAYIIIFGHWLDFFLVVSPELVPTGGFGFLSIGAMVLLGSAYLYVIFTALGKFKDLESSTHPFYSENIIHQI